MKSLTTNNLGHGFLVENCQRIDIKHFIDGYKLSFVKSILEAEVNVLGKNVLLITTTTNNGGYRYFYRCPNCEKRVGVLFKHPLQDLIGCRLCLGLEYRKRRFKGMIESQI